ncbi:MAG: orotate phosphoribosyltransferase [Candidatus Marinimicrobia bacterium]|nr:orotate phosphoribosyltransferase [Candidatus Neomarinimicrobiota bacterium]
MNKLELLQIFKETGALLEGHFILTSERRSAQYFQCAKVLQYPEYLSMLSTAIAQNFRNLPLDVIISPAIGGVVVGTEVGRQLNVRTIFAERQDGKMTIRRGFDLKPGEKVLVVEDVITTGGSVKEVLAVVESAGAGVVGVGVIVDRSNGRVQLHDNQFAILQLETVSFDPAEIPAELARIPAVKPGSRNIK